MPSANSLSLSIVVPVFNATESLNRLIDEISEVLTGTNFEVILVDDASGVSTWSQLSALARQNRFVTAVRLGRNSGQHRATLAGIALASGDICVTMDDDCQHDPRDIPTMLAALSDSIDVVYGTPDVPRQRKWRQFGSRTLRNLLSRAIKAQNAEQMSSFRLFRTRLRDAFIDRIGPSSSVDVALGWSTERFAYVRVSNRDRIHGVSGYSIRKLVRLSIDNAVGYSVAPLRLSAAIGSLLAGLGLLGMTIIFVRRLLSETAVPGFAFLSTVILASAGAQLLSLGVIGEYLARTYQQVLGNPPYVISEVRQGTTTADNGGSY
jgi:glycosyltransferase involved in cell wall biosynthesis